MKLSSTSLPLCMLTKQPPASAVSKSLTGCLVCVLLPCWSHPCEQELHVFDGTVLWSPNRQWWGWTGANKEQVPAINTWPCHFILSLCLSIPLSCLFSPSEAVKLPYVIHNQENACPGFGPLLFFLIFSHLLFEKSKEKRRRKKAPQCRSCALDTCFTKGWRHLSNPV